MAIPQNVLDCFNSPQATKVLVTSSKDGQPHAIVCGSIFVIDENTLAVGEILMKTATANMKENDKVAIDVINGKDAYEARGVVKGRAEDGPVLEGLNKKLAAIGLKARAVWCFDIKAVYNESAGPDAGKQIA